MEIVAALQRDIRVIPVLVDGARMPRKQDLPKALAPLTRRNAIEVGETRFHADVNRLIEAIEKSFSVASKTAPPSAMPAAPLAEPAAIGTPELGSKDLPEFSDFTEPAEPKEPEEIHADATSGAAPVSTGETTPQFPTQTPPPELASETTKQDRQTANGPAPCEFDSNDAISASYSSGCIDICDRWCRGTRPENEQKGLAWLPFLALTDCDRCGVRPVDLRRRHILFLAKRSDEQEYRNRSASV